MKKIAIIPARSGSKGLKNKNILDMCGKPMMQYSIESALKTNAFGRIIVSTDSEQYGTIATNVGAEVIYRGDKASNDKASTYLVIEDLFSKINIDFDYFVLLQPTSPLRTDKHVLDVISRFEANFDKFDFLVSVKEAEHPKILVNPIAEDGSMKYFDTDFSSYRRQDSKDYVPNGAFFVAKPKAYMERKHFYGDKSLAYIMDSLSSVDVDNELDYKFAKLCMKERRRNDTK